MNQLDINFSRIARDRGIEKAVQHADLVNESWSEIAFGHFRTYISLQKTPFKMESFRDVAWYSKRERIRTFRGHWCGAVKFETGPTIHIHQKPISLYKWLLTHYAEKGFRILDTHLGSGSHRIAAFEMGFDFTGTELDKDYFDAGNKRFEQHKQQLKLFAV